MQISEIRIKLVENRHDRLKAFCSITFDSDFVIRDLKIIDGVNGYFVAMPSRKITDRCRSCGTKNHLRAKFCNECGNRIPSDNTRNAIKNQKMHADIAHPINSQCREMIQKEIIEEYQHELERSKQPGYIPQHMDDDYDDIYSEYMHEENGSYHHSPPETKITEIRYRQNNIENKRNNDFSKGIF